MEDNGRIQVKLTDVVDEWLAIRSSSDMTRPARESTIKAYLSCIKRSSDLWSMALEDVAPEWPFYLAADLKQKGYSTATIKQSVAAAQSIWRDVGGQDLLVKGSTVRLPSVDFAKLPYFGGRKKPKKRVFSDQHARYLLTHASLNGDAGGVVALMLFTGRRVSELLSLRHNQIDVSVDHAPAAARIVFDKSQTKTGDTVDEEQVVFLPPEAMRFIRHKYGSVERVFDTSRTSVWRVLEFFSEEMRYDSTLNPHQIRHWFITRSYNQGLPIKMISESVGHASIQTTIDYISSTDEGKMAELTASAAGALVAPADGDNYKPLTPRRR